MLKKTFRYTDYDNNERVEDHYFNLTEAEAMEMELGTTGGLTKMIEEIVAAQDTPTIVKIFKEMILKAYGKKSPDGRRFMKSEEISREFSETEAYSQLFMELATDAKAAAAFVNGIVSSGAGTKQKNQNQTNNVTVMPFSGTGREQQGGSDASNHNT